MQNETKGVIPTGAGLDYRTPEQKSKDYDPKEAFASATPLEWKEKTLLEIQDEIKAHSISQSQTLRCVSEYAGIALEWAEFLETGQRTIFSRRDIYARRSSRPYPGMAMHDLFDLMREGACLESQLASTAETEDEIDQPYAVTPDMVNARKTYASGSSFTWTKWTIDDVARMIKSGTPVCLFWFFNNNDYLEWWNPTPKLVYSIDLFGKDSGRHQAAGVNFCLMNGKKHIVVMDSAGHGTGWGAQGNIRIVSEEFFNARCYAAGFTIDKKNLDYTPPQTIHYNFTRNLENGSDGDDVAMLQKILVLEGCMVLKEPTIHFRGMTEAGVKKLQEKYAKEILAPFGLKSGTGYFYESTRRFINKKYA